MTSFPFPFSAVVGQDELKLALLLNAIDLRVGGVLVRGEKGSGKSTLARALAALLPNGAPFVELPVGATEDRLVGTIDIESALTEGRRRFLPGLLAEAHGGVLYVDEVNLLPDHLVDVLLDVAASGVNRVEREGISHEHASRFVLIGSMNPEEGELRPQLLDRFGLAVDVRAPADPGARAEVVRRRLDFDRDPAVFAAEWESDERDLAKRLADARPADVPDDALALITRVCVAAGVEGLRADLVITRAAAALAGWEGRPEVTPDDVRIVAPLALAHRRRRSPFDEPGMSAEELDRLFDGDDQVPDDRVADPSEPSPVVHLSAPRPAPGSGRRSTVEGPRGRLVGDRVPVGPVTGVAVGATVRAAAVRRAEAAEPVPLVAPADLRAPVRRQQTGNLIVLAVDASGSMGAPERMEAVKGAAIGLLLDAYQRRDRVALVTFAGDNATVALRPTGSVEVARARLADLPTGGRTPLAAGLRTALDVCLTGSTPTLSPLLVVVSDGRATAGDNAVDDALAAAEQIRARNIAAVVVDAENGATKLGLAARLATAMGATHLTIDELTSGALRAAIAGVRR